MTSKELEALLRGEQFHNWHVERILGHDAALRTEVEDAEARAAKWCEFSDRPDLHAELKEVRAEVEVWKDRAKFADAKCGDYWKMLHTAIAERDALADLVIEAERQDWCDREGELYQVVFELINVANACKAKAGAKGKV
jgi:hypothetical protein